jgi:hypothetical protein
MYILNECGLWQDENSLWYTYGPVSLLIPLIVVAPIILLVNDSYKHYKNIKKYYPNSLSAYENEDVYLNKPFFIEIGRASCRERVSHQV